MAGLLEFLPLDGDANPIGGLLAGLRPPGEVPSAPTVPMLPAAPAAPRPDGHPLGGFGAWLTQASPMLMALGAGMASSHDPAAGIGKGIQLFMQQRKDAELAALRRLLLQRQLLRYLPDAGTRSAGTSPARAATP